MTRKRLALVPPGDHRAVLEQDVADAVAWVRGAKAKVARKPRD